ncbi:hypothetical protein HJFPF1_05470 [Paramyrothecium foliicola]|nr:hypothetical protein HJFPF1_05470 [Paramyrothecium foliicola]
MSDTFAPHTLGRREEESLHNSLGLSGVDLMAMVLSDSGLANAEPKWWNAAPLGCFLIGLQPRGGWQILQRAMQWGDDALARCFGVDCQSPTLYAYFACSIRNRLEVFNSHHFRSPMVGVLPGGPWNTAPGFTVKRPTKLIDGSRGGQAFIAEILAPEGNKHYTITDQSRMQLLSVLLVGAGLTRDDMLEQYIDEVLPADFDMSPGLGSVFGRLAIGLSIFSLICIAMLVVVWSSILRKNMFPSKTALAWITKVLSLSCWAVGAIGLLMMGGNPRVKLVAKKLDPHVKSRLLHLGDTPGTSSTALESPSPARNEDGVITQVSTTSIRDDESVHKAQQQRTGDTLIEKKGVSETVVKVHSMQEKKPQGSNDQVKIKVQFGSLHGSIFTPDRGSCELPLSLIERVCELDIKTVRSWGWTISTSWFGLLLLAGVTLQIGGALNPNFGADLMSLTFLLLSSLARGAGVSGPEKWMIPQWKRRPNTKNGAVLLGQYSSRTGGEDV